jgi:hypothetical protein
MRAQLQEARWLLKSLEIRHETLMKVARSIVERQTAFLEQGEEHMRPMILKDIAEAVAMHESTVSRVTSGKYMHTPRGVFELRYFFSSQVEGADGSGTSSTAIRAKIRKLVKDEDAETPLSDGHRGLERAPAGGTETDVSQCPGQETATGDGPCSSASPVTTSKSPRRYGVMSKRSSSASADTLIRSSTCTVC